MTKENDVNVSDCSLEGASFGFSEISYIPKKCFYIKLEPKDDITAIELAYSMELYIYASFTFITEDVLRKYDESVLRHFKITWDNGEEWNG
jgi:hypothetical protein